MWCVVGLGNPDRKYQGTRHNLGFTVVDRLAARHRAPWHVRAHYCHAILPIPEPVILVKPTTYMNLSGSAVASVLSKKGIAPGNLLVICDDMNLPFGTLRLRARGSDGGHLGLASIIQSLGTQEYPRLRLGIGRDHEADGNVDYLLSRFTRQEARELPEIVEAAVQATLAVVETGIQKTMNSINRKIKEEPR